MDTVSHDTPPYVEHQGAHRQYIRDVILGVNDGLVSIFLLVVGVVGGGLASPEVLLAAIAASIAGAISMAAGEYMATKSQEEVFEGELELERVHFEFHRERELDELREMLGDWGLEGNLLEQVVETVDQSDDTLMKAMMALEFGVLEEERRSPYAAAVVSGGLFLLGSLPPVLPFAFQSDANFGLLWAAIASSVALFAVGSLKTRATRKNPWISGLENLAVAVAGAALSFGIGNAYEAWVA